MQQWPRLLPVFFLCSYLKSKVWHWFGPDRRKNMGIVRNSMYTDVRFVRLVPRIPQIDTLVCDESFKRLWKFFRKKKTTKKKPLTRNKVLLTIAPPSG